MNTKFEEKDEITVKEYKAWLAGFMYSGDTPNLDDVELILKMADKIVPDVHEVQTPSFPQVPYTPVTDEWAPWWENQPTCTDVVEYLNGITITSGSTSMELKDSGDISINDHSGLTVSAPTTVGLCSPHIDEDNEISVNEILNKIRERSAESKKTLDGHKFDTSKYNIVSTPSGHTTKLIKEALSIEDEK